MKKAIVVGGGVSGLATAYLLRKKAAAAGVELEITLLEKEPRVGGKIWQGLANARLHLAGSLLCEG